MINVLQLTDSPFFGGPERQILGLAVTLRPDRIRTRILCFADHGSSAPFLAKLGEAGVSARMLRATNPHFGRMIADVAGEARAQRADVLVCHGYKADVIGQVAARRAGVPVVAVSRGWTAHTMKVRLYERLDRRMLRRMDAVVCVSEGQARRVRAAGVDDARVHVIRNSIDVTRFDGGRDEGRALMQAMFAAPRSHLFIGVGRLSPEKGFDRLLEAARRVVADLPGAGFVLAGDGPDRVRLERGIRAAGLSGHVVLAGFRPDIDRLVAGADVLVQSSFTEGLPNVVLEACAAGVAVVATDVGGTGEVITHGVTGLLVPPRDPHALAARMLDLAQDAELRLCLAGRARARVRHDFSFAAQGAAYEALFRAVAGQPAVPALSLAV